MEQNERRRDLVQLEHRFGWSQMKIETVQAIQRSELVSVHRFGFSAARESSERAIRYSEAGTIVHRFGWQVDQIQAEFLLRYREACTENHRFGWDSRFALNTTQEMRREVEKFAHRFEWTEAKVRATEKVMKEEYAWNEKHEKVPGHRFGWDRQRVDETIKEMQADEPINETGQTARDVKAAQAREDRDTIDTKHRFHWTNGTKNKVYQSLKEENIMYDDHPLYRPYWKIKRDKGEAKAAAKQLAGEQQRRRRS